MIWYRQFFFLALLILLNKAIDAMEAVKQVNAEPTLASLPGDVKQLIIMAIIDLCKNDNKDAEPVYKQLYRRKVVFREINKLPLICQSWLMHFADSNKVGELIKYICRHAESRVMHDKSENTKLFWWCPTKSSEECLMHITDVVINREKFNCILHIGTVIKGLPYKSEDTKLFWWCPTKSASKERLAYMIDVAKNREKFNCTAHTGAFINTAYRLARPAAKQWVKKLLEDNQNLEDACTQTGALIWMAPTIHFLKYLEEIGIPPQVKSSDGYTALHGAINHNRDMFDVIRYLVEEWKVDVNAQTSMNFSTPLMYASSKAHKEPEKMERVILYLLSRPDINIFLKDRQGTDAQYLASKDSKVFQALARAKQSNQSGILRNLAEIKLLRSISYYVLFELEKVFD